jgi:ribonuclease VapC
MLIETSAIVAILLNEPEHEHLLGEIVADPKPTTSIVNAVEAALGVGKQINDYKRAGELVEEFLDNTHTEVQGIPADLYRDIVETYVRYGKGTGHPAKLNFGDCFSYAMAKRLRVPLLYKGTDFSRTDLAAG